MTRCFFAPAWAPVDASGNLGLGVFLGRRANACPLRQRRILSQQNVDMPAPRVLILRSPGTNCDEETAYAFEVAGAEAERVHVNRLIENPALSSRFQILCLPGGFSYGDDIAAGRILASRMQQHLCEMVHDFSDGSRQRLILGICNGMQVLMRLGLLTGELTADHSSITGSAAGNAPFAAFAATEIATLTWNDHGRFEDRWVHLRSDQTPCVFLRGIEQMYLPMAHAQGKFVAASPDVRDALANAGQLALRYSPADPTDPIDNETILPFPQNPNGSDANVAGVCDTTGRIFGLMPHPERHIDPTHHPYWTRRTEQPQWGDGFAIFRNAVEYFS